MTFRDVNLTSMQRWLRAMPLAVAGLTALMAAGNHAAARSAWSERSVEANDLRAARDPIMVIVSLRNQRITVYDAEGWILRAPVSSGQKGRETPAGIYSVIQKVEDHTRTCMMMLSCPTC